MAVKIQYPGALPTMRRDLIQIRRAALFLQRTELRFDLTSPVDELAAQVRLEFDFVREARLMTRIRDHLRVSWALCHWHVAGLKKANASCRRGHMPRAVNCCNSPSQQFGLEQRHVSSLAAVLQGQAQCSPVDCIFTSLQGSTSGICQRVHFPPSTWLHKPCFGCCSRISIVV